MQKSSIFSLVIYTVLLSGCTVIGDLASPELPSTPLNSYRGDQGEVVKGRVTFAEEVTPNEWWKSLESETINHWVEKALIKSPNVRIAKATLAQALAKYNAFEAELYPTVDLDVGVSHQASLKQPLQQVGDRRDAPKNIYTLHNVGVNVSYSIDIFGRVDQGDELRHAQLESAKWEWQATMNTLVANVVTTSINLANIRAQIKDTEKMLALQERQLATTLKQRKVGVVSDNEVTNAELAVVSTKLALPSFHKQQKELENLLMVLMGEYPREGDDWTLNLDDLVAPAEVPLLIPSALIRDRPDIRIAEAQFKAAHALMNIAELKDYPYIAIGGGITSQALGLANLLETTLWSLTAGLAHTLFDGGARDAQQSEANATFTLSQAAYEQTVLNAFANVSNALSALEEDSQTLALQNKAVSLADRAYELAQVRYRAGSISQYDLLSVERTYYLNKINYTKALSARLSNVVALYLAAGSHTDFSDYLPSALKEEKGVD